jgi:hypothetical chaperone protein
MNSEHRQSAVSCGVDFGTSNSTVAIVRKSVPELVPVDGDRLTIPTALFFTSTGRHVAFGREAIRKYTDGEAGRFMRAIKSILGRSLFHESTPIQGRQVPFSEVLSIFIGHLKESADRRAGREISHVVLGRPVQFIDDDEEADRQAQADLERAARKVGFRHVEFQFEPIAAALYYEQDTKSEEVVFVVDVGGGTADFSIVKVSPENAKKPDRQDDILANRGVRIGGTDFDRMLSLAHVMPLLGFGTPMRNGNGDVPKWIYHDLSTWSQIPFLYSQKTMTMLRSIRYDAERQDLVGRLMEVIERQEGHRIIDRVERAKIALTDEQETRLDLEMVDPGVGIRLDRHQLENGIRPAVDRIRKIIAETIRDAGLEAGDVRAVFLTGGSTMVPAIQENVSRTFQNAKLIAGDMFGSVGKGLGLDAWRKFNYGGSRTH